MNMGLILISIGVVGLCMAAMAVGVLFSDRCLRGSCGGKDVVGADGDSLRCEACPKRRSAVVQASATAQSTASGTSAIVTGSEQLR